MITENPTPPQFVHVGSNTIQVLLKAKPESQ